VKFDAGFSAVMPGLVPGIHVLSENAGVDGRDKPGHDEASGCLHIDCNGSSVFGGENEVDL
jgi:hypothetical protein